MLIFGGQAIASVGVFCQKQGTFPQHSDQKLMSDMFEHSHHMALTSSTDKAISLDDCPDCDCSLHRCFSSTTLLSFAQVLPSFIVAFLTDGYNEQVETSLTSTHFRPPIAS